MLQENTTAPDFVLKDHQGQDVRLSDFTGKHVIVYFYPKDETPGCTKEACSLRDGFELVSAKGAVILGISPDSPQSHLKFRQNHNLPFTLLSDPDHKVLEAWGAWGEKKLYGKTSVGVLRSTFILDGNLKVLKVIKKVDTAEHAQQILQYL